MSGDPQPDMVNRYLDGLLSDAERRAFDESAQAQPELHRAVVQQQRLDAALSRLYLPTSDAEPMLARLESLVRSNGRAVSPITGRSSPRSGRLALAAAVLIMLVTGWQVWVYWKPRVVPDPYANLEHRPKQSFLAVYRSEVEGEFNPDWVCGSDEEFVETFKQRLGYPVFLGPLSTGTAMIGLAYAHTLSPQSIHMLGRVDGRPVVVFVDRLSRDRAPQVVEDPSLNLFRRELGTLVLYELSPLPQPSFLDRFLIPD